MAVIPDDLLSPLGPVEEELFPGEEVDGDTPGTTLLEERLTSYIAQAVAKIAGIAFPDADEATKAWALHLTFNAAHILLVARPSVDNAQVPVLGSEAFAKDQRERLLELANEYLDDYTALLVTVPTTNAPTGIPTRSTSIVYDY